MSSPFDSDHKPPRLSIFDEASDDDNPLQADPFLSHSRITANVDSHPAPSAATTTAPPTSVNIAGFSSPSALQQDRFATGDAGHGAVAAAFDTPIRPAPQSRTSYDSPANDPWSSTPRTNGMAPVTSNFPHRINLIPPIGGGEHASYLLDADHIDIRKSDEMEGIMGFKHVNYLVASAKRGTQVVRRYSDFSWLLDVLIKRYPFRQIPLMPPKRLAGNCSCLNRLKQSERSLFIHGR